MACALAAHGVRAWLNGRDPVNLQSAVARCNDAGQGNGGSASP
jgi:hypothetical protein